VEEGGDNENQQLRIKAKNQWLIELAGHHHVGSMLGESQSKRETWRGDHQKTTASAGALTPHAKPEERGKRKEHAGGFCWGCEGKRYPQAGRRRVSTGEGN